MFAKAYQRQTGGTKTGQAAITELLDAMKKRKVKGDILTFAGDIASETAQPGLDAAGKASQAEQARYQNAVNDLAVIASQAGVEEGFARIFRTLTTGLNESGDLVRRLAQAFNDVTLWTDDLLLWPQSFQRALEGRDSLVADWLGADRTKELIQDWKSIKEIWSQISAIKPQDLFGTEFLPSLQATSRELAAIMGSIGEFQRWQKSLNKDAPKELQYTSDTEKVTFMGMTYTSPAAIFSDALNNFGVGVAKAKLRGKAIYDDPDSPYYQDAYTFDRDPEQSYKTYAKVLEDRLANENSVGETLKSTLPDYSTYKKDDISFTSDYAANLGVYPSEYAQPDPTQQRPQNFAEMSDWAMQSALAQKQAVEYNNTNNNTVTVNVSVTNPEGVSATDERQVQVLARAVADEIVKSMEQTQDQFPAKQ